MARVKLDGYIRGLYYDTVSFAIVYDTQLNGFVLKELSGDPGSTEDGQIWYAGDKFRCQENGVVGDLRGTGVGGKDFTLAASQVADFTAAAWTEYPIGAANVDITTPAAAASGDEFALIFTATRANCTLIANTGTTLAFGGGSPVALTSPGSSRKGILVLKLVGTEWIPRTVNTWA